ncbi:hypothetical protein Ancab_001464 [Ancistrocladus abbreviatus]
MGKRALQGTLSYTDVERLKGRAMLKEDRNIDGRGQHKSNPGMDVSKKGVHHGAEEKKTLKGALNYKASLISGHFGVIDSHGQKGDQHKGSVDPLALGDKNGATMGDEKSENRILTGGSKERVGEVESLGNLYVCMGLSISRIPCSEDAYVRSPKHPKGASFACENPLSFPTWLVKQLSTCNFLRLVSNDEDGGPHGPDGDRLN